MMLILAILATTGTVFITLAIAFANGMSDAPEDRGIGFGPAWALAVVAALLWTAWAFGWKPEW